MNTDRIRYGNKVPARLQYITVTPSPSSLRYIYSVVCWPENTVFIDRHTEDLVNLKTVPTGRETHTLGFNSSAENWIFLTSS